MHWQHKGIWNSLTLVIRKQGKKLFLPEQRPHLYLPKLLLHPRAPPATWQATLEGPEDVQLARLAGLFWPGGLVCCLILQTAAAFRPWANWSPAVAPGAPSQEGGWCVARSRTRTHFIARQPIMLCTARKAKSRTQYIICTEQEHQQWSVLNMATWQKKKK